MSAFYGFICSIPLRAPRTEAQEAAVAELEKLLDQCEDVSMEDLADERGEGVEWIEIRCPSQNMTGEFRSDLDAAIAKLGGLAADGFALEFDYDGEEGVEFHGPTEQAMQAARHRWNMASAKESLKEVGLDLAELLKAKEFAESVASLKIWGEPDPDKDGEPFEPCDGVDDSHACLMDLIRQARGICRPGNLILDGC